jgi:hypothetical protein
VGGDPPADRMGGLDATATSASVILPLRRGRFGAALAEMLGDGVDLAQAEPRHAARASSGPSTATPKLSW